MRSAACWPRSSSRRCRTGSAACWRAGWSRRPRPSFPACWPGTRWGSGWPGCSLGGCCWGERLAGMLMVALYRCGQRAGALRVFREIRGRLAGELGVEPGPELQEVHRRILVGDAKLAAAPARPAVPAGVGSATTAATLAGPAKLASPAKLAGPATVPGPANLARSISLAGLTSLVGLTGRAGPATPAGLVAPAGHVTPGHLRPGLGAS